MHMYSGLQIAEARKLFLAYMLCEPSSFKTQGAIFESGIQSGSFERFNQSKGWITNQAKQAIAAGRP